MSRDVYGLPSTDMIEDLETKNAIDALVNMLRLEIQRLKEGKPSVFDQKIERDEIVSIAQGSMKVELRGENGIVCEPIYGAPGSVKYRIRDTKVDGGSGGGEGNEAKLCKVRGSAGNGRYRVDVYEAGKSSSVVSTDILEEPDLSMEESIPSGRWIVGHTQLIAVTGG